MDGNGISTKARCAGVQYYCCSLLTADPSCSFCSSGCVRVWRSCFRSLNQCWVVLVCSIKLTFSFFSLSLPLFFLFSPLVWWTWLLHSWSSASATNSLPCRSRTLRLWTLASSGVSKAQGKSRRWVPGRWEDYASVSEHKRAIKHLSGGWITVPRDGRGEGPFFNAVSWLCAPLLLHRFSDICCSPSLQIDIGLLLGNSQVIFEKAENSSITLVGRCSLRCKYDFYCTCQL